MRQTRRPIEPQGSLTQIKQKQKAPNSPRGSEERGARLLRPRGCLESSLCCQTPRCVEGSAAEVFSKGFFLIPIVLASLEETLSRPGPTKTALFLQALSLALGLFSSPLPSQLTQEIFLLWSDTPTRPVSWGTSGEGDNGVSGEVGVGSGKGPVLRDLDLVPVSSFPGARAPPTIESLVLASRSNRGIQAHKNAD